MKITDIVLSFADFLNQNWTKVNEILDQASFRDSFQKQDIINDWLQANWEVLVEYVVCKPGNFLSVYDSGADCHPTNHPMSERVTCPEKYPNYFVQCVPKPGLSRIKNYISNIDADIEVTDKDFCKFVSCSNGYYNDDVPFNFVLLNDEFNATYVVSKYDIDFILVPI